MNNENKDVISKNRTFIIMIFMFIFFLIIIIRMFYMQTYNLKASIKNLDKLSKKEVYGMSMPRGRIYDRNLNVIVDNVGINIISYKREKGVLTSDEVDMAYLISKNVDISYVKLTDNMLRDFWIVNNPDKAKKKITKKEYELYERRKIKASKLESLKKKRITDEELSVYDELDKEAAYIYYLMNHGYSYDEKIIKEGVTDKEYAYVLENKEKLKGFSVSASWNRVYPYGDTLRQILGSVSTSEQGIPESEKAKYLSMGYSLNDRVGLSYLEYQYEDVLKGKKDKYEIKNGKKTLVEKGKRGDDIVLSIDINLQKELEKIIEEELLKAKSEANTEFYDHTSVVITDPSSGQVLAMASKQITKGIDGYKIRDYTTNILTGSDTLGSVVKGASMLVGYRTGALNIGDVLYDKCIKFKNTPKKCSWKDSLGPLNDIKALALSSNSYQFQTALKVAGVKYYYNMPIKIDNNAINTYRNTFKELGLGVKSEIDLPNETKGYSGKQNNAGLLLNFSIGQYDTYSALQLSSYLNTIINEGERLKLNLVKEVREDTKDDSLGKVKKRYEKKVLNKVDINNIYFKRVKEGFKSVMEGSLGRGYMGDLKDSAGKTGTSESFYDSSGDGKVDTETYSKSFIGYYPYDNPVFSIVSISPHVRHKKTSSNYESNVNKRIVSRICNIFFEIYK
ncbi:MAG: penicillin-binding protein 2 [Bacilli bacterium]|nr:penicillin-binding protein 2 [Bacilli bacterium]